MRLVKAIAVVACVIAPLACADSPDPDLVAASDATLARVVGEDTWVLTEFITEAISDREVEPGDRVPEPGPFVDEDSNVSMKVIAPGRVGGYSGCNEYSAEVLLQVTRFSTSDLVSGTEPCPSDAAERLETYFLAGLRQGGELFIDTSQFPAVLVIDLGADIAMSFSAAST